MLGLGVQEETVQQYFVPVALRVVPQLLVWVKEAPLHTVFGFGVQLIGEQLAAQADAYVPPLTNPEKANCALELISVLNFSRFWSAKAGSFPG